jgi:hypothetical protein
LRSVLFGFLFAGLFLTTPAFATSSNSLAQPVNGAQVSGQVTVAIPSSVNASSADYYADGVMFASRAPTTVTWDSTGYSAGSHTLSATAYAGRGPVVGNFASTIVVIATTPAPTATPTPAPSGRWPRHTIAPTVVSTVAPTTAPTPVPTVAPTSAPTIVPTVAPTPTEPAVSLLAPANNSNVSGTIYITAQINSSSVGWINFYCDGSWIASSPPTSILWASTSVPDGSHTLSVTAYGVGKVNLGSAATTVTVANLSTTPTATATAISSSTPTATSQSSSTPTATPTAAPSELRPTNQIPNNTMPTASELSSFISGVGGCGGLDTCGYMQQVNGQFTGTTTAILEFEADKWCPNCTILNPYDGLTYSFSDLAKAIAVNETNWYQWKSANLSSPDPITQSLTLTPSHGDLEHVTASEPDGGSWGIFQIAEGVNQGWPSSFPLSAESTAFNADFKLAEQMGVEQGHLDYLTDPSRAETAIANGYPPYASYTDSNGVLHPASTDVNVLRWGAVGNWYSGGWYDSGAIDYINQVQQILHNQPWNQPGF